MANVVLFHHAQGLTSGMLALADHLRRGGHTVHAPDLYDGATFDTLEQGVGHAQQLGFGTLLERGADAAAGLPVATVYAGVSLGVMPAQMLAQSRPGAQGAVLCESCVPPTQFGHGWPADVPVQIHGMDADPYFAGEGDIDVARHLVDTVADGELFLYPGDKHLFADSSLGNYDEAAATLLRQRILHFLARVS